MEWKLFWVAFGAVLSFAVAAVTWVYAVPAWLTIPAVAVALVVAVKVAATVVQRARMFATLPAGTRGGFVRWIASAQATYAAWVACFALAPDLWAVWLLTLVGVSGLVYWVARGHEWALNELKPAPPASEVARAADRHRGDKTRQVFYAALQRAGYDWLNVLKHDPIGDPPFGVRFRVRTPSKLALAKAGEKSGPRLTTASAEPIAIALGEVLGIELESQWVQVRKEPTAGTYSVVVVTEDVMARVYPYTDELAPTSVTEPALVGYQIDGKPYRMRLDQHGQVVGKSTGGKSSLINVMFAHTTRCDDAVTWVCGTEKLYDLVAGWIEPYMDTDHRLPFDWIASGQRDTLAMLIAGMNIARWRQRQPMARRGGWPKVLIVLDEASFALRNGAVRDSYQGQSVTAAQMAAMLTQGGASAGVYLLLASQRSTNDHFGDYGGDTSANAGYTAGFASNDDAEIGRLTGDYRLPMPRHKGEYWLNPGNGDAPVNLKAPYIQAVDPTKPQLHDGATIAEVAWSRRRFGTELDPGSAEAAGEAYQRRHTRMNADLLRYLTDATDLGGEAPSPHEAGYAAAMRELEAIGVGPADNTAGIGDLAGRASRADRIVSIVTRATEPMARAEILAALHAAGDAADPQVVTNALTKLTTAGRLIRHDDGGYTAPTGAPVAA